MSPRAGLRREPGEEVTVSDAPATPGEERIRRALLRRVRAATAQDGRLPGEFDLAAELGCSRVQVRQALADLGRSGLIRGGRARRPWSTRSGCA